MTVLAEAPISHQQCFPGLAVTTDGGEQTGTEYYRTVTINRGASGHTKGTYAEIIAATTKPVTAVTIVLLTVSYSAGQWSPVVVDVAIGGAGSEVVVVPNVPMGARVATYATGTFYFVGPIPITIPKGSRVAMRQQSRLSIPCTYGLIFHTHKLGIKSPSFCYDLNLDLATTHGTVVDNPSGNVKTAWAEAVASTPYDLAGLVVGIQGAEDLTFFNSQKLLVDVGMGSAGNERVIIENLAGWYDSLERNAIATTRLWRADIPKGSRIAVRQQSADNGQPLDVVLTGVPA